MSRPETFARSMVFPIDLIGLLMMFASIPAGLFIQARALDANIPQDAPLAIESVKFSSPSQQLEWKPGTPNDFESKPFFTTEPITMSVSLNRKISGGEWDGTRFEATNKNFPTTKVNLVFPNKTSETGSFIALLNSPNPGDYAFRLVPPGPVKHAITGKTIPIPVSTDGKKPELRMIDDAVMVKKFSTKATRFFEDVDPKLTYRLELSPPIDSLNADMFINMRSPESNPSGVKIESVKKVGDGFDVSAVPYIQKQGNKTEYLELGIRPGVGFKTTDGRTVTARKPIQADSKVEVMKAKESSPGTEVVIHVPKPPEPGNVMPQQPKPTVSVVAPMPPTRLPELTIVGSGTAKMGDVIKWQLTFPVEVDAQKVRTLNFTNANTKGPVIGPVTIKPGDSRKQFQLEAGTVAPGEYRLQVKADSDLASGSSPYKLMAPVNSDKPWRVMDAPPPLPSPVLAISGSGTAKVGDTLTWKLTLPVEGEYSKVKSLEFTNASPQGPKLEPVTIEPVAGGKEYRLSTKANAEGNYRLEIKAGTSLTSGSNPYKLGNAVVSDKEWKVPAEPKPPITRAESVARSTQIEIPKGKMLGSTIVLFVDTSLYRKKKAELGNGLIIDTSKNIIDFDRSRDVFFLAHLNEEESKRHTWGQPAPKNPPDHWMYKPEDLKDIWNGLALPRVKKYYMDHGVKKVVLIWCDETNQDSFIKTDSLSTNPDCNLIVIGAGNQSRNLSAAQKTAGTILQLFENDPWLLLPDSIRIMINAVNRKK